MFFFSTTRCSSQRCWEKGGKSKQAREERKKFEGPSKERERERTENSPEILAGYSVGQTEAEIHQSRTKETTAHRGFAQHNRTLMDSKEKGVQKDHAQRPGWVGVAVSRWGMGESRGPSSPRPPPCPPLTLVQDGVGGLVASQRLLGQVLVALGQTLHLGKAGVESHGGVAGVLRHVQVGGPAELLFDHQSLFQELEGF